MLAFVAASGVDSTFVMGLHHIQAVNEAWHFPVEVVAEVFPAVGFGWNFAEVVAIVGAAGCHL